MSLLVLGAFLLRLAVFLVHRNTNFEDEVFQVTEPAHRLLFGTGYVSWEWVVGARSWLWPGLVAGLMALGRLLGEDPDRIRLPVVLFMAAVSTVPVLCAALWGRRFGGLPGALVTGTLSAVWVDQVYLAVHPLSDVIAGDCLAAFLYLACPGAPAEGRRRLFWAGVLAGATLALRVQLGPALAVAALMTCGSHARRWPPFLLGAAVPVAILGAVDWATLGVPFQSVIVNVRMNIVEQVSVDFGVSPWHQLFGLYFRLWGGALPIFLLAVFGGARKLPVPAMTAFAVFVTFSLFGHKEYRFVYPAIPLLTTLAGLGTTELVLFLRRQRLPALSPSGIPMIAAAFWIATSYMLAMSPLYSPLWTRGRGFIEAFRAIADRPDLCGVGLYRMTVMPTPGNSGLPPATPLYETDQTRIAHDATAFNVLLAWPKAVIAPETGFDRIACYDGATDEAGRRVPDVCVWRRPGRCVPGAAAFPPVNWPSRLAAYAGRQDVMEVDYPE